MKNIILILYFIMFTGISFSYASKMEWLNELPHEERLKLMLTMTPSNDYAEPKLSKFTEENLKSFDSDGCSGPAPESILGFEFKECCVLHDVVYWAGGMKSARHAADLHLRSCIENKVEIFKEEKKANINRAERMILDAIAPTYYYSVRSGGWPEYKLDFSWGYGWDPERSSRNLEELLLTEEEQKAILERINQIDLSVIDPDLENFILSDKVLLTPFGIIIYP